MKYLTDYIEEAQTKAFDKAGAFFAFSDKQFQEAKKKGVIYTQLGVGLLCPKDTAKELVESLNKIHKLGRKKDLTENSKEGVIKRELSNHEAYYTGDIAQTFEALADYGITKEEIKKVYYTERQLQD